MIAIERCRVINHRKKIKKNDLKRKLAMFIAEDGKKPGEFAKEIRDVKSQLEIIGAEQYRRAIVRARSENYFIGESPTQRSISDEKEYAKSNDIKEINYGSTLARDKTGIEHTFVEHYRNLINNSALLDAGYKTCFWD